MACLQLCLQALLLLSFLGGQGLAVLSPALQGGFQILDLALPPGL